MRRHPTFLPGRQRGFTLIELLVTVTVMVVMLGIGVPSFKNFTASQRVKSAAYDVASSLLIARSEAVKRKKAVTIAPVTAGSWMSGWTVQDGTTVITRQDSANGLTITGPASVSYQSNGRVGAVASFEVTSTVSSAVRCVKVDVAGVPSTSNGACS